VTNSIRRPRATPIWSCNELHMRNQDILRFLREKKRNKGERARLAIRPTENWGPCFSPWAGSILGFNGQDGPLKSSGDRPHYTTACILAIFWSVVDRSKCGTYNYRPPARGLRLYVGNLESPVPRLRLYVGSLGADSVRWGLRTPRPWAASGLRTYRRNPEAGVKSREGRGGITAIGFLYESFFST
jgi:hypothetical protein